MEWTRLLPAVLGALALVACRPAPDASSAGAAAEDDGPAATLPFRAQISFEPQSELPQGARLAIYVLEADFDHGSRRVVAEMLGPVPAASPAAIQIDVARGLIKAEMGYEVHAAMVDADGRLLMSAAANKAPTPATGLYHETIHKVTLLPVATPAPPEQVFGLPGTLAFRCAEIEIEVRQVERKDVLLALADTQLRLSPAVATAGGRFSDGMNEFWITDDLQAFLMLRGQSPRTCQRL